MGEDWRIEETRQQIAYLEKLLSQYPHERGLALMLKSTKQRLEKLEGEGHDPA